MQLERLDYFVAVAEELHFGRAAARLHLSQPALSQQIKRLESDLGATLCVRSAHGVELTPAGELLADSARDLLTRYALLRSDVRAVADGSGGTLRLALTRSDGDGRARSLLTALTDRYPEMTVETESGWTAWNLASLDAGDIDAAVVRTPLGRDDLEQAILGNSEIVALMPSSHPLARQRRLQRGDLLASPVIFWPRRQAPAAYDSVISDLFGAAADRVRITHEPDGESILAAVGAGRGIGLLDRGRAARHRGLVTRRFTGTPPHLGVALAWRPGRRSPALSRLVDLVDAEHE